MTETNEWGLTATGIGDFYEINIHETLSGKELYGIELDAGNWMIRWRLPTLATVRVWLTFLQESDSDEIVLGSFANHPVVFVQDREFDDRYFLRLDDGFGVVHFTIAERSRIDDLIKALGDAQADIDA